MTGPRYDLAEIRKAIAVLFEPGQVVEVRMISRKKHTTVSGWFDDHEKMAKWAAKLARDGFGEGNRNIHENLYWTINPVCTAMLSRQDKNTVQIVDANTGDAEITGRRWLPIDIDPKRPYGVSSTKDELKAAENVANVLLTKLSDLGFSDDSLVIGRSGNGYHILVRIDLPNDKESAALLKKCLGALQLIAGTDRVDIDQKVFNAGRILKCYGTMACKGADTEERPWRMARLLRIPEKVIACDKSLLEKLAAYNPPKNMPAADPGQGPWTLDKALDYLEWSKHGFGEAMEWNGATKWQTDCVFDSNHRSPDAYAVLSKGWLNFHCSHNSCREYKWKDWRAHFDEQNGDDKFTYPKNGFNEEALLAKRRRLTFLPSVGNDGGKQSIIFPKEPLLKDEMDEWLVKVCCYTIGVSAQPFLKMMNRASAQESNDAAKEAGLGPAMKWVEDLINLIIQKKMGLTNYEFSYQQAREVDAVKQAQADSLYCGKVKTVNEIRQELGYDPRPEPECDLIGEWSPQNGFMPITGALVSEAPEPPPVADPAVQQQNPPEEKPSGQTSQKIAKSDSGSLRDSGTKDISGYSRRREPRPHRHQ